MHSHALQEQKSQSNKMHMYYIGTNTKYLYNTNTILNANVHLASRPKFHVLSNGILVFTLSPILYTGKWIKLLTETVQPPFSANRTELTFEPFERA